MSIRSVVGRALLGITVLTLAFPVDAASKKSKGKSKVTAPAPARKMSIALGSFSGNKPSEVRGWVRSALNDSFVLTDAEDFKPKNTNSGYAKMARDLGVEAVVVGKVERNRVVLTVRDSQGVVVEQIPIEGARGAKLKKAIQAEAAAGIGTALGVDVDEAADEEPVEDEEVAADEEVTDEETTEGEASDGEETTEGEESAEGEETASGSVSGSPFIVMGGIKFFNRSLTFNDTLTQLRPNDQILNPSWVIRDYKLRLGPAVFIKAQLYPAALFGGEGFAANLGIIGGFEQGIPVTSKYEGSIEEVPSELTNNTQDWHVGVRLRAPGESTEFAGSLAYGQQKFILEGDERRPIVPDVTYSYLRLGGEAWVGLGKVYLGAELGLRAVFGTGELEELWFPQAGGNGIDLGLRVGYQLTRAMSVVVGGDLVRYGFDFNPIDKQRAKWVAGGAVDQYLSGFLGLSFTIPGSGTSSAFGMSTSAKVAAGGATDSAEDADAEESGANDTGDEEDVELEEEVVEEEVEEEEEEEVVEE